MFAVPPESPAVLASGSADQSLSASPDSVSMTASESINERLVKIQFQSTELIQTCKFEPLIDCSGDNEATQAAHTHDPRGKSSHDCQAPCYYSHQKGFKTWKRVGCNLSESVSVFYQLKFNFLDAIANSLQAAERQPLSPADQQLP